MSNSPISCRSWLSFPLLWLASCLACNQSSAQKAAAPEGVRQESAALAPSAFILPTEFPEWADTDAAPQMGGRPVTIVPEIQNRLERFVRNGGNPIAALVVANVKTGEILAMVQGQTPGRWGSETHSALHVGFPTASLFKTVVAAAGFEIVQLDAEDSLSMFGGCAHVNPRGIWPPMESNRPNQGLSLKRAYGHSCNGFFAKLAVNRIGLGPILTMARKLGWGNQTLASDFFVPQSPLREPNPSSSSINTIGKFAAGFGSVGLSAVHAAWQYMVIANDGIAVPLHIFKVPDDKVAANNPRAIEAQTAISLKGIMDATVMSGTASSAFSRGRLRVLRTEVGGKTGTLNGNHPQGLTTWFAGIYPLDDPEIAVASVVMLESLWKFKATNLAAEAIMAYHDYKAGPQSAMRTARKPLTEGATR